MLDLEYFASLLLIMCQNEAVCLSVFNRMGYVGNCHIFCYFVVVTISQKDMYVLDYLTLLTVLRMYLSIYLYSLLVTISMRITGTVYLCVNK